jgi:hypothetical protein
MGIWISSPFASPAPQAVLIGLTLTALPAPVDRSEVMVTLFLPAIQVVPLEVVVPSFHPEGNKYS